ncbi:uncharacterized protein LOC62_03G005060 [Vanrija pseudolonga]|uniref:Uncharacterized protein n=1 Tax=Vanrija pseudolonga TaxID=143232 RepID=A0AAF1BM17_9TREE|nr:hypothetical protein LOC62_03G005060 [Vanrija pseudolonga]
MTTPQPDSTAFGFELRVRALEARVGGVPASQLAGLNLSDDGAPAAAAAAEPTDAVSRARQRARRRPVKEQQPHDADADAAPEPLTARVSALVAKLEAVVGSNPALKQFYDNYDAYAPLLRLSLPDETEEEEEGAEGDNNAAVQPRDLLPVGAKAAMVLEAKADIVDAERGLREIGLLDGRGVAGAGELEDIVALKPALVKGQATLHRRQKDVGEIRADVAALVSRYTEFTTTVSDLFVDVHEQLVEIEEVVARAERARRNEVAGRY